MMMMIKYNDKRANILQKEQNYRLLYPFSILWLTNSISKKKTSSNGRHKVYIVTNILPWVSSSLHDYYTRNTRKILSKFIDYGITDHGSLNFVTFALMFVVYFSTPALPKLTVVFFQNGIM